ELRVEAGRRIPLDEAGPVVVVAVRVVPVADEVACELDLEGRVVDVVPGVGRLAKPDLKESRRNEQRDGDDDAECTEDLRAPRRPAPAGDRDRRDDHPGENPGCPDEAEVPVPVGDT